MDFLIKFFSLPFIHMPIIALGFGGFIQTCEAVSKHFKNRTPKP